MELPHNQYLIGIESRPLHLQEFFHLGDEEQSYLDKEVAIRTMIFVRKLAPDWAC